MHDVDTNPQHIVCHTTCTTQVRDHTPDERWEMKQRSRTDNFMSKRQVPTGNVNKVKDTVGYFLELDVDSARIVDRNNRIYVRWNGADLNLSRRTLQIW